MKLSCFVCHRSLANLVHSKVSVKGKSSGRVSCVLVNDRSLSTFFRDHVKMQRKGQRQAHPSHRWINKTLDATSRRPAKSLVHSSFLFLFVLCKFLLSFSLHDCIQATKVLIYCILFVCFLLFCTYTFRFGWGKK